MDLIVGFSVTCRSFRIALCVEHDCVEYEWRVNGAYLLVSRNAIWNIECTDSAVSARHPRSSATGCIKCTKCSVITSLTGCRVGNSATT